MESGKEVYKMVEKADCKNENVEVFSERCVVRDGFVFTTFSDAPKVYDVIVIRNPRDAQTAYRLMNSTKTLDEHIELINNRGIEKAMIFAEDIDFITKCPNLKKLDIIPADTAEDGFDFSPLYDLDNVSSLCCHTQYGKYDQYSSKIDYSYFHNLTDLCVSGSGHLHYDKISSLEHLSISSDKSHTDLRGLCCCKALKGLSLIQCTIESLDGIEHCENLQSLDLSYNKKLKSARGIEFCAKALRVLSIHNCSKISDFSFLNDLENLEYLELFGTNELPDLYFLKKMKKLKTFSFSMTVKNYDLTPCLSVPYVDLAKGNVKYNLRNKDLPKQIPSAPFNFI